MGRFPSVQPDIKGRPIFDIEVQPNSMRSGLLDYNEWRDVIRIAVKANAQKGAANREVIQVLSVALGLTTTSVEIISGLTTRRKRVCVTGMTIDSLLTRLVKLLNAEE